MDNYFLIQSIKILRRPLFSYGFYIHSISIVNIIHTLFPFPLFKGAVCHFLSLIISLTRIMASELFSNSGWKRSQKYPERVRTLGQKIQIPGL